MCITFPNMFNVISNKLVIHVTDLLSEAQQYAYEYCAKHQVPVCVINLDTDQQVYAVTCNKNNGLLIDVIS